MNKRKIGNTAEEIVSNYLKTQGYEVIEKNFTIRGGEIDIIALEANSLVFIEVKYRTSDRFGEGIEQLTWGKCRRIKRASLHFLQKNRPQNIKNIRYDFISLTKKDSKLKLQHFKNVEI